MSNETINFIDDLVTGRGCNIAPMEVLGKLRQRFGREYDVPALFHHLSQRFDLQHKSENIEFVKEFIKEYTKELRDSLIDEIQIYRALFVSDEMIKKYEKCVNTVIFIDSVYSPKFLHNHFFLINGITQ